MSLTLVTINQSILLLRPLLVQLLQHFLPTGQDLQSPALPVVIPSLGNEEIRDDRPSNHERRHHLQHVTKVLALPVILLFNRVGFEGVG